LAVTIDGIDLRDIQWKGQEAVRRVYPVFQDRNWTNRLFRIEDASVHEVDDGISLFGHGTGSFDAAPLTWQVEATIDGNGIEYRFRAETSSSFWRNRLGLCVLHPMSAAGADCSVQHMDGSTTDSQLPEEISPHQPFIDMQAITHTLPDGARCAVEFVGDTFEMEDHRNWTDASFKTYCTPITLPFPVEVTPGEVIEQSIRVSFDGGGAGEQVETSNTVHIEVSDDVHLLPRLGLCLPTDAPRIPEEFTDDFSALNLDHLRVDIDASDPRAIDHVLVAVESCERINAHLRVACTCETPEDLVAFATLAAEQLARIDCWYVFARDHKVTPDDWADRSRAALGPAFADVSLGGGTDLYFTELNREPPDPLAFDELNFSLNPQVHAFDDRTLIQNAMTQFEVARYAERLTEPAGLSVSPITLRPRFNPNATDPESDVSNTALPSNVDFRQRTLFAACWTAMSIKYLAAAETIDYATYFETTGWTGIVESPAGSADPEHFPSGAGEKFPVWEVFAALADATAARSCTSDAPEEVDALIVEAGEEQVALIANYSDRARSVTIGRVDLGTVPAHQLTVTTLTS